MEDAKEVKEKRGQKKKEGKEMHGNKTDGWKE